jgi:hypothetical protein
MRQNTSKYQYKQLETYKELLELKHLKSKTLLVNMINVVFAIALVIILVRLQLPSREILGVSFLFIVLFIMNILLTAYPNDLYNNLKIAMYINTIWEYVIAVTLILMFKTPSIFTSLFLAYAITSIYQDYKAMLMSNGALFITGFLLTVGFVEIFSIPNITAIQNTLVVLFLVIFVMLLTLSSYILIKRKTFFYNHLAQSKEAEVRNMELLSEVALMNQHKPINSKEYYKALNDFSSELSKKIGIENIFTRKIQLLKDLKKNKPQDLHKKYPDYTLEEMNQLLQLELDVQKKVRNIGLKASISQTVEIDRKEIFSESQFKSFKHFADERYVKIISFVVFYCLVKIDKPYLKEKTEAEIKDILFNSEYFYLVDRDIIEIYLQNNEVFDTIVNDILKGSWNYEKNR